MNRHLRSLHHLLTIFGIDFLKCIRSARELPAYYRDLKRLREQQKSASRPFKVDRLVPCLGEKNSDCGSAKGAYFHQDLLVARRIHHNKPERHLDIGSRIDGFVAHVASFRAIEVMDIRSLDNKIPAVTFKQADLMAELAEEFIECTDSLSCLHTIEHFGLGRYGDRIDHDGYLQGLQNLHLILKPGGKFYFSTPIGPERVEFNAHRVFSVSHLLERFEQKYHIDHFSYVDDSGDLHENAILSESDTMKNYGCMLGCGIFEMTKL